MNDSSQHYKPTKVDNGIMPTPACLYHLRACSYSDDLPFLLSLAEKKRGKILEIGCGTGRVLRALSEKGFTAYGIDIWPEALLEAKKKASSAIVSKQDVRRLNLKQNFDLILMTFNVLELIESFEDKKIALENIRTHLKPDGVLCIDTTLFDIDLFRRNQPEIYLRSFAIDDRLEALVFFRATRTADMQRSESQFRYLVRELAGERTLGEITETFIVSPLTFEQLQDLLTKCGFKIKSIFSDYSGKDFDPENDRHALVLAVLEG